MPENRSLPPLHFCSLPQFCARTNAILRGYAALADRRAGARHYPVVMAKVPPQRTGHSHPDRRCGAKPSQPVAVDGPAIAFPTVVRAV
jgi:hypothetical protein